MNLVKKRALQFGLLAFVAIAAIVLMIAVVLGSRSDKPALIRRTFRPASRVFEGFAYAGQDLSKGSNAFHVSRFLPYRVPVFPMPASFVQGHKYYFHRPLPADAGVQIAQDLLAPRLRTEGFDLTEGEPANGIFFRGFDYWELGDGDSITTWSIQFKRDQCTGVISYQDDPGIRENPWGVVKDVWDSADYVLQIEGGCDF